MTKQEIEQRVNTVIESTWDWYNPALDFGDTFEEMAADSLDVACLVMEIEKEFNIRITDEDAVKFKTADDIVEYVLNL